MYFQNLDNFHSKPIAIALSEMAFSKKSEHNFNRSITQLLNFCINCFVRDDIAPSTAPDPSVIRRWIHEKPDLERLLSDQLPEGPTEGSVAAGDLEQISEFVQFVAEQEKVK